MQHTKTIRSAKVGYILVSVLLAALGLSLILISDYSPEALRWLGGSLLLLFGVIKLLAYLSKDLYRLAFQHDLAFGILLLLLGAVVMLRNNMLLSCILLGLLILSDSLLKIQISIDAQRFGISLWWMILGFAVLTALFGLAVLFLPLESSALAQHLLGLALLGEGGLNLTTVLTAVQILRRKATPPHLSSPQERMDV